MSALTADSKPVLPATTRVLGALAAAFAAGASRLVQTYRNRSQAAALAAFDDRMLADIGLTRGDVRDASSQPLWHDPTELLRARALERRLSRHGISFGLEDAWFAAPPLAPTEGAKHPASERPARHTV